MKKILLYLFGYTFFFLSLFFFLDTFFFHTSENTYIEENYIEKSKEVNSDFSHLSERDKIVYLQMLEKERNKPIFEEDSINRDIQKYVFLYKPEEYQLDAFNYQKIIQKFFTPDFILDKVTFLQVAFYKDRFDVRWKFEKNIIKLFSVVDLWYSEMLSVFVHEFWHYVDLYYLLKQVGGDDTSKYFYSVSWENPKILKEGMKKDDFVSGYAMTNQYEDFAESFTYYVFQNDEFKNKSLNSPILFNKYTFFSEYIFQNNEFKNTNFSLDRVRDYYWDVTKIHINLEKFLQYVEK